MGSILLSVSAAGRGWLVLPMIAVDGPQIALHQGVLAQPRQDIVAPAPRSHTRQLRPRPRKMTQLIAVLPQQLAGRHLVLVQFPDAEQHGQQAHGEGQSVLQGYAEAHVDVTQNVAEGEQGGYHEENGDEQGVSQVFHTAAALLQARYSHRKVLILTLDPRLLHPSYLAYVQLTAGKRPNIRGFAALEDESDPAEAAEPVDSR